MYILLLTGLLSTDCHIRNIDSSELDMAATISGSFYVTYCQYLSGTTNACSGSATITRINANTIQADYVLSSGNPFRIIHSLKKMGNVISLRGGSGFGYYRKGKLFLQFADSTLHVHFQKKTASEISSAQMELVWFPALARPVQRLWMFTFTNEWSGYREGNPFFLLR